MQDIAVIILNYNTAKLTLKCVESVVNLTSKDLVYSITVIDNNSELEDYTYLKNNFPKYNNVKLVRSFINYGFGGGNLFGAQFVNAKYLLFLNNDAFLKNDCLSILYKYMESNHKVGVSTAQNYDENDKFVISFDHNKGIRKLLFGRSFLEKNWPKEFPKRKKEYKQPISVNFVNGAFMFFRADVFASVGGFDSNIFLYFEEMDICHRIAKKGFTSNLVPEAKINHYQGASTKMSKAISKEGFLSHLYVIRKNYSYTKYLFIRTYYLFTLLIKPKKWFLLKVLLRGAHLSESLRQQQPIIFFN